jgi:hypothetical protein
MVSDERQDMIAEMPLVGGGGIGILPPPAPPFNELRRIVRNAQTVGGIWRLLVVEVGERPVEVLTGFLPGGQAGSSFLSVDVGVARLPLPAPAVIRGRIEGALPGAASARYVAAFWFGISLVPSIERLDWLAQVSARGSELLYQSPSPREGLLPWFEGMPEAHLSDGCCDGSHLV